MFLDLLIMEIIHIIFKEQLGHIHFIFRLILIGEKIRILLYLDFWHFSLSKVGFMKFVFIFCHLNIHMKILIECILVGIVIIGKEDYNHLLLFQNFLNGLILILNSDLNGTQFIQYLILKKCYKNILLT